MMRASTTGRFRIKSTWRKSKSGQRRCYELRLSTHGKVPGEAKARLKQPVERNLNAF